MLLPQGDLTFVKGTDPKLAFSATADCDGIKLVNVA
jgi:hypothetical protein